MDIAALQLLIVDRLGPMVASCLTDDIFPSFGVPSNPAEDYVTALFQATKKKHFVRYLQNFVLQARESFSDEKRV